MVSTCLFTLIYFLIDVTCPLPRASIYLTEIVNIQWNSVTGNKQQTYSREKRSAYCVGFFNGAMTRFSIFAHQIQSTVVGDTTAEIADQDGRDGHADDAQKNEEENDLRSYG